MSKLVVIIGLTLFLLTYINPIYATNTPSYSQYSRITTTKFKSLKDTCSQLCQRPISQLNNKRNPNFDKPKVSQSQLPLIHDVLKFKNCSFQCKQDLLFNPVDSNLSLQHPWQSEMISKKWKTRLSTDVYESDVNSPLKTQKKPRFHNTIKNTRKKDIEAYEMASVEGRGNQKHWNDIKYKLLKTLPDFDRRKFDKIRYLSERYQNSEENRESRENPLFEDTDIEMDQFSIDQWF